jgi:hypothetical protein
MSYTVVDPGPVVITAVDEDSGISESDKAFRLRMVNTTGSVKTVSVYQASTGSINEFWTSQIRYKVLEVIGLPIAILRVFDNTNTQIASSAPFDLTLTGLYHLEAATLQLTAASADLRWELLVTIEDTETLDMLFTNTQLAISPWQAHYVPSVVPPVTREADVIDVGLSDDVNPFFSHATDQMWSIDFRTLGTLSTVAGVNQLQYIFSSYDGVNGTNLFVDAVDTLTWQADFNGSLENVSVTIAGMGDSPFRVFFRITTNGGNFDRQLFVESLLTGTITASTVLTTANLPIHGLLVKLGRDDSDANYFDGFLGRFMFWDNRSNLSMNRINTNWPV